MPRTTLHFDDGRTVSGPAAGAWIGTAAAAVFGWLASIGERRGRRAIDAAATRLQRGDPELAAKIRAGVASGPVRG